MGENSGSDRNDCYWNRQCREKKNIVENRWT